MWHITSFHFFHFFWKRTLFLHCTQGVIFLLYVRRNIVKNRCVVFILIMLISCLSFHLFGADVYVRAGASGKGSKDAPYGDLWKAMDRAIRGDVIHLHRKGRLGCIYCQGSQPYPGGRLLF
jgi:hypothetical protein